MIRLDSRSVYSLLKKGGALLVVVLFLYVIFFSPKKNPFPVEATLSLGEPSQTISLTLADTPEERQKGLSFTPFIPKEHGMLFVFEQSGIYGFWMKDMRYGIDIIWIDETFSVVEIAENITPDTYPTVFYPPSPVKYVLELAQGESARIEIKKGQTLFLKK